MLRGDGFRSAGYKALAAPELPGGRAACSWRASRVRLATSRRAFGWSIAVSGGLARGGILLDDFPVACLVRVLVLLSFFCEGTRVAFRQV